MIAAAAIGINVWIMQLGVWGPCVLGAKDGKAPTYCPYVYRSSELDIGRAQKMGHPTMEIYAVPTLFILYAACILLQNENSFCLTQKADIQSTSPSAQ